MKTISLRQLKTEEQRLLARKLEEEKRGYNVQIMSSLQGSLLTIRKLIKMAEAGK